MGYSSVMVCCAMARESMVVIMMVRAMAISAVAVGKKLDALGYRANKRPTALALEHGLARIKEDHFGQHISWHLTKTVHTLQGQP